MKNYCRKIFPFILALQLLFVANSSAHHLMGSDFSYKIIQRNPNGMGGIRIQVFLDIYRDCSSAPNGTQIDLPIYKNNLRKDSFSTISMPLTITEDVSFVTGANSCFKTALSCLKKDHYENIIDLPDDTTGYHLLYSECCLAVQNNLDSNQDGNMIFGQTYHLEIPDTRISNNSAYFTDVPLIFTCKNDTLVLQNKAIDEDGDSLVFDLVAPYDSISLIPGNFPDTMMASFPPVKYKNGYDAHTIFGSAGVSSVDKSTGDCLFKPAETGNFILTIAIKEYRQGRYLGEIRRNAIVIVVDCPPNTPPVFSSTTTSYSINAGDSLCFSMSFADSTDSIYLYPQGFIFDGSDGYTGPKALLLKRKGLKTITGDFCWVPTCNEVNINPYLFNIVAKDDACNSKSTTVNFNVLVLPFRNPSIIANGLSTFCEGDSIELNAAHSYSNYLWSTGETTKKIIVKKEGTYYLSVSAGISCNGTSLPLNIHVVPLIHGDIIFAGKELCKEDSAVLSGPDSAASYWWSTGEQGQTIVVKHGGNYTLTVSNHLGCATTFEKFIEEQICGTSYIHVPSAFSPVYNNSFDVFRIYSSLIQDFEIQIFSRWNHIVFNSLNPNETWDGNYHGEPMPAGIYCYVIHARGFDHKSYHLAGTIALSR